MKRYIFSISLHVIFFSTMVFGMDDEAYFLTTFTNENVAKYWLVKQLHLQDSAKKDVIELKINRLLANMQHKQMLHRSDLCRMNLETFAYVKMGKDSPVYGHYFAFDKPDNAPFTESICRLDVFIIYTGRIRGGNGIPEFHEFWSNEKMKAKKSLGKGMEFDKTSEKAQIESDDLSDFNPAWFISDDVD